MDEEKMRELIALLSVRDDLRALVQSALAEWVQSGLTAAWLQQILQQVIRDMIAKELEALTRDILNDIAQDVVVSGLRQVLLSRFGISRDG